MIKSFSSIIFLVFCSLTLLVAQPKVPDRPNPPRLVNDFAGILSADETARLETELST